MVIITASYIIGIILGLYLRINIALFACLVMVVGLFSTFIIKQTRKFFAFMILFIIIVSFSYIKYKESKADEIYSIAGEENNCVGVIVSVEKENDYYYNYLLKIKSINNNNKYNGIQVLLKISKKNTPIMIELGDLINVNVALEKPAERRNYGGYNYANYLKTKNVYLTGKVNENNIKVIKKNSLFVVNMWISNLRFKLKSNSKKLLPKENESIGFAILLGDTSLIPSDEREMFSRASLSHVLAISGMHVGIVVICLSVLMKRIDKRKSRLIMIFFLFFSVN